jgi:hypothetical protein
MTVCGLVTAGVVVLFPESREFRIAPYFWILIAMAVFEGIAFAINRGARHHDGVPHDRLYVRDRADAGDPIRRGSTARQAVLISRPYTKRLPMPSR